LPNRTLLNDRLSLALIEARRSGGRVAVLALDLNRFKAVNDGFGHAAGDRLLVLVASRLSESLRAADTLARLGGDEFVVIQTDAGSLIEVAELANRLLKALSDPFELDGHELRIGTSVGVAMYPMDGDNVDALLKNADTALYSAKADQHGGLCFFEAKMGRRLRERCALEQDLRMAVGTRQLRLYYQPVFESVTRSITGFEALLRWRHPVLGEIAPTTFIPIAEETGVILPIGAWVLEEACRAAAAWDEPKWVAVNLSAAQLRGDHLPAEVRDILRRTSLPPYRLELEVTETLLISNPGHAFGILRELQDIGVRIACDDFGTGYSSFNYLQKLAFDRIKID
jgi:diguanylate cyclase (GGDEF)-like protein